MNKVTVRLIDMSTLEGEEKMGEPRGVILINAKRSHDGESGFEYLGRHVFIPWSSILYCIQEE